MPGLSPQEKAGTAEVCVCATRIPSQQSGAWHRVGARVNLEPVNESDPPTPPFLSGVSRAALSKWVAAGLVRGPGVVVASDLS